jgi:hypothetical protein
MLQVLNVLNISDIALNFRIIAMFIIVDMRVVQMKPVRGTAGECIQSRRIRDCAWHTTSWPRAVRQKYMFDNAHVDHFKMRLFLRL